MDPHLIGETAASVVSLFWTLCSVLFTIAGRKVGALSVNAIRIMMAVGLLGAAHLLIFGTAVPASTNIPLKAGWNMVGYPSFTQRGVSSAFSGAPAGWRVQNYSATGTHNLRDMAGSDLMQRGCAYWVYMPADWTWTVPR